MPTGDPRDAFIHENPGMRIAENTYKHAAEYNKKKWDDAEQRC